MGLRPGRCYNTLKDRAYSRTAVKVHKRNYIGATPGLRTRQFNMGNPAKKYNRVVDLVTKNEGQIRDNSIEAVRIAINRALVTRIGKDGFFMRVRIYPYQILRENKMATGAGADRVSQGMGNCPFGKPIGRAARVRAGQKIISVLVAKEDVKSAAEALMKAKSKITCGVTVVVGEDIKSIGTLPRKRRLAEEEEKLEKEEEEAKEEKKGKEKKEEEAGEEEKEGEGKKEEEKKENAEKDGKPDKKEEKK